MPRPKRATKGKAKGAASSAPATRASAAPSRDATRIFHREWLGLAQPIEGLVFSVPALDEAPAPSARADITARIRALEGAAPADFFRTFLGYDAPGMLVARAALPADLTFYAPEGRQEIRPSFAIARGPFTTPTDDPFAIFDTPPAPTSAQATEPAETTEPGSLAPLPAKAYSQLAIGPVAGGERAGVRGDSHPSSPFIALVWDLADDATDQANLPDLDAAEDATGPWRYPPTAKLERLLRHVGIPVGFVSNRRELRLVYAPAGEATSHLTFRFDDLADPAGRPIALALELLFHARRTYGADPKHTFEGLLAESRRRQADVTEDLAEQVKDAVELLLGGIQSAATRDITADRLDWLGAAMEAGHVYEGILNAILRLVFLLYAEDRSLLPVAHPTYAAHLSVLGLYERLVADAGAHPESMHQRYGAYGALVSLFRAVYFGVRHGDLHLPPRQGRLFDPSAFPFLEGGLPEWTAAVSLPEDRAAVRLPTVDDGTLYEVLHRLVVLDGQRISYRDLSVEQIGAVYESLMGFEVRRVESASVRLGKLGFWVDVSELRRASKTEQNAILDERCGLSKTGIKNALEALKTHEGASDDVLAEALVELASGGKDAREKHRARVAQLVLQPTASRRSTGSHYTPRSLSEKVVRRTLEPILACLGETPTADEILELKVCDPAMGSGAFLVEACRFLGLAVVEAWRRSGALPAIIEKEGDAELHAKRLVAQRCLYGVDKNAAAVELAKLSLWLETLSADKPFTFLDHVLRHGDSLVGLDLEQVRAFHWKPEAQLPTVATLVDRALAEVKEGRDAIQALADDESDWAQREKRRLLEIAELAMDRVKLVADVCVGAFFAEGKARAREEERARRLAVVEAFLAGDEELRGTLEAWAAVIRKQHAPFHWHLELPEVFFLERRDPLEKGAVNRAAFMDAFVGNPPFVGGTRISVLNGDAYRDWLADRYHASSLTDLSAFFFRRVDELLGRLGAIGMIATNSIAQGDSRTTSLGWLARHGARIYCADRDMPWPGDAGVSVSIVHVTRGLPTPAPVLDGHTVARITSYLSTRGSENPPVALHSNAGLSVIGSFVLGIGFVFDDSNPDATPLSTLNRILRARPESRDVVRRYLGGEELNRSPTQSSDRYVIDFEERTAQQARAWPELFDIVETKVKPARATVKQRDRREEWWRHATRSPVFRAHVAERGRALALSQVSTHLALAYVGADVVLSHTCVMILLEHATAFAVLQSRLHIEWALLLGSSMKNDPRYTPTDCFETFPFPATDPRTMLAELEATGEALYRARAAYMVETQQGLTQTYNLLKRPDCTDAPILHLRRLHEEMDRAVLDAYAWKDIEVPPFCATTPADQKALEMFQDQAIDRLFALNAERAAEEARVGAAAAQTSQPFKEGKRKRHSAGDGEQGGFSF